MGQGERQRKDGGGSTFVLLTILVLIVGIIAAAGMVMAMMNYRRSSVAPVQVNVDGPMSGRGGGEGLAGMPEAQQSRGMSRRDQHFDDTVWTILIENSNSRLVYFDRRTRQQRGYYIDVINEVCKIAQKNCEIVYAPWDECYSGGFPQRALLGRWVDGCMGFSVQVDRLRSVKFSVPAVKAPQPVLLTRRGNPRGVNPDNLRGVKIGILNGWWADALCISTTAGYDIHEDQVFGYNTDRDLNSLIAGLEGDEVDAIFISGELGRAMDGSLEVLKEFPPCILGGDAIMMRKDSLMKSWWDPAFDKLVKSRAYRELCNDIDDQAIHGSQRGNVAADICVNL